MLVELADDEHLKEIFNKYAKHSILEQKAIKSEDLVQKYLGLLAENDFDEQTLKILANSVDLNKDGYVTYDEFKSFQELLSSPDGLFKCAFQLFDKRGNGYITFGKN